MSKYISGNFVAKTDVGKVRLSNEDQACALTNARGNVLLIVCDGMGGQSKGDYASMLAANYVTEAFRNRHRKFFSKTTATHWLVKTIRKANEVVYDESCKSANYQGMGTTLTAVLIIGSHAIIAQVGDSRAYFLEEDGTLKQVTEDQTFVSYLVRTGQISEDEALVHPKRHVLLNALGIYPTVNVDFYSRKYNDNRILVCSDGLYNNVKDTDIANIMKNNDPVNLKATQLMSIANSNGGSDNIAVVLWEANN